MNSSYCRVVTVTLSAIVEGDKVVIFDSNGRRRARIENEFAKELAREQKESIELRKQWQFAFAGMMAGITSRAKRLSRDPWAKKISVWQKSLRWRRNRKREPAKAVSRCYSSVSRPTWERAVIVMRAQYNNRLNESRLRNGNQWRLWSQTVAGNHRKKRQIYEDNLSDKAPIGRGDGEGVRAKAERSGFQVCFDWDRVDTCSFVA
jgi:hypothetical protein